jgi:hypothetical protein
MTPSPPLRGDRRLSCDCEQVSFLLFDEIEKASAAPLPLDGALLLGRRLALQWEPVNQCVHVDQHLDAHTLLNMAHAIERMLKLYEVFLASTLDPPRVNTGVVGGSGYQPAQPGTTPIFLGSLEVRGEEARMVSQQALRHIIARMGDILKDIDEDCRQLAEQDQQDVGNLAADVRGSRELMLRLLGRVPRLQ